MDFRLLKKANMAEPQQKTLFSVDRLEFPRGIPKRSQTLKRVVCIFYILYSTATMSL